MPKDTSVILPSSDLRGGISSAWRETQETGGPLVVTVNTVPEFAIYPLGTQVPMIHEDQVRDFARRLYDPLVGNTEPPLGHRDALPEVGPDALRRNLGEERRRIRRLMTPFAYTHHRALVGLLFPIPHDGGLPFVEGLSQRFYPERYEQVPA